ncbi:sensor histidine kinase [Nitrospina watsonii]|uniref:histidine kinase n=1 Tax=Nitrospina watsonii TaxID=1323948 RepID=A0ABM9HGI0_9BACT|nr:sensor histidine kinase [Nitrospina watsonii]CAI2719259.1 Histidine kinase domain-containing protein [Nitrospina watsonii]
MRDTQRQRLVLILIMTGAAFVVVFLAIFLLYQTAFEEEKARLIESAQSQARLMEAVARFDSVYSYNYPEGTEAATLSQFIEAHKRFKGFGVTGEFILAKRVGDKIKFLLSHRHASLMVPDSIPFDSPLGEPIRRALNGESGIMVGPDYRNIVTLAAYEPIEHLPLALVAKIDLAEIRAPFYKTGLLAVTVGAGVIGASIVLFWRFSNPMVEEITRSREQLRQFSNRLQAIREEEQTRIARAVHDELGQALTALKLEITCLQDELDPDNPEHQQSSETVSRLIDQTIAAVQRISTELRPHLLDVFGLAEAMRSQVQEIQKRTDIEFDLKELDQQVKLDPERATALFRIFQETLTNIVRHAQASRVSIRLKREKDHVMMEVQDNGIGIRKQQIKRPQSLGLLGIRERVLVWQGTVHFHGVPGQGTTVTVKLPVNST